MDNYEGEKLLDKIYKDLYNSKSVQHTRKNKDKREESIRRYMDRLERVHSKANTEHKKNLIKSLYFDKYVIKEENIFDPLRRDDIISSQKKRLSDWIDYLTDENSKYPMWAKYWAFQGMLRMGTYDELRGIYTKRSSKTEAPFLEVNPELIAKCIDNVIKMVNKKALTDAELQGLIEIESFQKLYTLYERQYKEELKTSEKNKEGIWIKYNYGSEEDAIKLSKSLDGMNTGWCTASESTAINQVCGGSGYEGGDFYVYYTMQNGEYVVPRIAIRLNGHDRVGEIRGIDSSQNIEESMLGALEKKLNEMTFLSESDVKEALRKIEKLRELSIIGQKTVKGSTIDEREIMALYTEHYGFGWVEDPTAIKIRNLRNFREDYNRIEDKSKRTILLIQTESNTRGVEDDVSVILNAKRLNPNLKMLEVAGDRLRDNKEFVIFVVKEDGEELRFASEAMKNDKDVVLAATTSKGRAFKYASEALKNDKEVVLAALDNDGDVYRFVSEALQKDDEVIAAAVKSNGINLKNMDADKRSNRDLVLVAASSYGNILRFTTEELQADREIVLAAVHDDGLALKYASEALKNDKEVVLAAVKNNGDALDYASATMKNDKEIVLEAVSLSGLSLRHASADLKNDLDVVLVAVTNHAGAISCASKEIKNNKEAVKTIVSTNAETLRFMGPEIRNDKEIVLAALNKEGRVLDKVGPELKNDKEVILAAVNNDGLALQYASPKFAGDKEVVLAAVSSSGNALCDASEELRNDKEVVLAAINDMPYALRFASEELKKDKEVVLTAVNKAGRTLQFASEEMKGNREVVLAAIMNDGSALQYASEELTNDREIILMAVEKGNEEVSAYIGESLSDEMKRDIKAVFGKELIDAVPRVSDELIGEILIAALKRDTEGLVRTKEKVKKEMENSPEYEEELRLMLAEATREIEMEKEHENTL